MSAFSRLTLSATLLSALAAVPLTAQQLHTNTRWKQCAIVLDPSLTPGAWHRFVSELDQVLYYRPQIGARPLGRGQFEFSVLQTSTRIDTKSSAWNDTFSHPDSTHWLTEGNALPIPSLAVRAGVSDRLDVGGFITKNFQSNYGLVGAQGQYALRTPAHGGIAVAGRVNAAWLFGPADMTYGVYGVDLVASRRVSRFEPYAVLSGHVGHGAERTTKVDLPSQTLLGAHATLGMTVDLAGVRLAAEYTAARVDGYAFKVGYAF